jgi:tagatose 6-phosphate kinase
MILTVTMNAAIDKTYIVDSNIPGKVQRVKECRFTPGGKGLNVARVLHAAGEDVLATGLTGGHAGAWVEENLNIQNVTCEFEHVSGETRTCINVIEPDGRQTEFLEPGFTVSADELASFERRFFALASKCDVVTLSGSVPIGVDKAVYARMIKVCQGLNIPVLLDSSGTLLAEGIRAKPSLIKPNLDELSSLAGTCSIGNIQHIAAAAKGLHDDGIGTVVVSMGAEGSVTASRSGVFRTVSPHIDVQNATGCGDSMMAGLAIGYLRKWDICRTLTLATAIAAASAMEAGTGYVNMKNAENLMGSIVVAPIPCS